MEIRTLGFYQPFCSLMLHGKKETRWVRKGRKPPFPLGNYLFYSTKKKAENPTLFQWCGAEIMLSITNTLEGDITRFMNGTALATGRLVNIRPMVKEDEAVAFVLFKGEQWKTDKNGAKNLYMQWILEFEDVNQIPIPFKFEDGKQGVGKYKMISEQNVQVSDTTEAK